MTIVGNMANRLARALGALWILEGVILIGEDAIRAFVRGESGPPFVTSLLIYSLLVVVGGLMFAGVKGWRVVAVLAALYQGGSHFIYLSNEWPTIDVNTTFSLFAVGVAVGTIIVVLLSIGRSPGVRKTESS